MRQPPPSPPPAPSPPEAEPEPQPGQDDIVVTAPTQQSSIDRQTYIVRDTPEARSTTTTDILGRIPSVEVQADGTARLIGAGQATILIDGRRVADPQTMLRNMTGNQIERIEVLTNPGAQFPAQGTGGIINIITRRNTQNGLGGSATASGGSYGSYDLRISPTYGAGNWTFTGNLGHGRFEQRADFERDRFALTAGRPGAALLEDGEQVDEGRYYYGNGSASYRPTTTARSPVSRHPRPYRLPRTRDSLLTAASLPGGSADVLSTNDANFNYRDLGSTIAAPPPGRASCSPPR
jgi:outer membrane receptor for ferrienterochelin and colicins